MNPQLSRLQIATRIHFFLKRELGTGIDIEAMLEQPAYAGAVLRLCDKARGTDLEKLGCQFRVATAAQEHAQQRGRAKVAQPWGADTSGFGVSSAPQPRHAASPKRKSSPPSGT